jgi:hypothetical protein
LFQNDPDSRLGRYLGVVAVFPSYSKERFE